MLTPDYFYGKSDKLIEMYQELEDWIISDIAMRLIKSGEMSGTTDRELWKLQQMGLHHTEIVKRISKMTGKSRDEVRRLLRDSVMTSFSDDAEVLKRLGDVQTPLQNNAAIMAMNAEMMKTFGELNNLTRTTMLQTQRDLLNMLNEVDYRVASGMQSYSSAICEVLDRYAQSGVVIDYPTGARRSLEAAVRCCVVTSMNQTAAQVTNQYIAQKGIEYVLVSAHMGARHSKKFPDGIPSHDHWQGKVYKIVGSDKDTPNLLDATGYTVDPKTGQGRVVDPLGLHGYNCRHSHKPWDKSLRNPYVDADGNPKINVHESQELYEKQQQQRSMERAIRQTKRELLAKQAELSGIAETDVKDMLQPQYDKITAEVTRASKTEGELSGKIEVTAEEIRSEVSASLNTWDWDESKYNIIYFGHGDQGHGYKPSSDIENKCYLNLDNGTIWQCVKVANSTYAWEYRANAKLIANSMTSAFKQTSREISTKVQKDNVISSINQTAESIKIKASKLQLDGDTRITGGTIRIETTESVDNIIQLKRPGTLVKMGNDGMYAEADTRSAVFQYSNITVQDSAGGKDAAGNTVATIAQMLSSGKGISSYGWESYSDRRLKHGIKALDKKKSAKVILKLVPCEFIYNFDKSETVRHGFTAQNAMEAVDNEWEVCGKNNVDGTEYYTLDKTNLIADLVATVQLQHEEIKELKETVGIL